MESDCDIKETIREGWSDPGRVEGWVESGLCREFNDPAGRKAWLGALGEAANGMGVRSSLDVGTGPGTLALLWAELGFPSTGLDFSPAMLEAGRNAAEQRQLAVDFVAGDAESPPFPEGSFDVVSSRFVLFTLPHPGWAIRCWLRLLRPNGILVLVGHDHPTDPKRSKHHSKANPKWQATERHREALRHLPFANHTSGELRVVMEASGLENIHFIPNQEIIAARAALSARDPDSGPYESTPFVLVGRKIQAS